METASTSRRAMSDEPNAEPAAQARAEASPKVTRRAPSEDTSKEPRHYKLASRPIPHFGLLQRQPPPLPPHSTSYVPMSLPPPPFGYDPALDRIDRLPPVAEDSEPEFQMPSPPAGEGDAAVKDAGGRPTTDQAGRLVQFVQAVRSLAVAFGEECNLPLERFLTAIARSVTKKGKGSRIGNGWNLYESFARSERHAIDEYMRIAPDFDPATMTLPQLTSVDLRDMYNKFQETFPDGEAETILEAYSEYAQLEQDETLASRQRQFDRVCSGLQLTVRFFIVFLNSF